MKFIILNKSWKRHFCCEAIWFWLYDWQVPNEWYLPHGHGDL